MIAAARGKPAPRHRAARAATGTGAGLRLWRHRQFRALWLAIGQSQFGDQLGRVALSILVFRSTGSGGVTAAVYALTYLPAVLGGVLLAGWADRYPRRTLLVGCDLARAACFAAMALPMVPVAGVAALLVLAVTIGAPHKAAEPAVVADLFLDRSTDQDAADVGGGVDRERAYTAALGLRTATIEVAQLAGFALGGLLVAATGPRQILAVDALTFVVSALLLRSYLSWQPPAAAAAERRGWTGVRSGIVYVIGDPRLRTLLALSWLAGCWLVPEGLAAPYASAHGGGASAVGVLLAADPVGVLIGSLVLTRTVTAARRNAVLGPLAVLSGVPLLLFAFSPSVPLACVLLAACGALSSYQVLLVAEFLAIVPSDQRGQLIGIAASGLLAAQGIGVLVGGVLSTETGTAPAIALAGAVGAVLAMVLSSRSRGRAPSRQTARSAAGG